MSKTIFPNTKTIYGPVKSWRFGMSLGVDPIFETSTCSFNCLYCQLGNIQNITNDINEYVSTSKVINDYKAFLKEKKSVDVITYSGSGEPSLAKNLGEMISGIRELSPKIPQYILSNATHLSNPLVKENLKLLDKVIVKIDAPDEQTFQLINRPAEGVTLKKTIAGILDFKSEYKGSIEVQTMFMPVNDKYLENLIEILKEVSPEAIQLNTPKRPYPLSWHRENRGNHELVFDYEVRELKTIDKERAVEIQNEIEDKTGTKVYSVYR